MSIFDNEKEVFGDCGGDGDDLTEKGSSKAILLFDYQVLNRGWVLNNRKNEFRLNGLDQV